MTQTSVASGDFYPQCPLGTPMEKGPLPGTDIKEHACSGFLGSRQGCVPTALWVPGRLRLQAEDFKAFFPPVPCALVKGSRARFLRDSPAYSPTPQALGGVPWCQLPKDSEGFPPCPEDRGHFPSAYFPLASPGLPTGCLVLQRFLLHVAQ